MKTRLFITTALALLMTLPVFAQSNVEYQQPKLGTIHAELLLGNTGFLTQGVNGFNYLLADENSVGFNGQETVYMNLGDMNSNAITNMVGVRVGAYVHPQIDVNVLFGMNMHLTPSRDYIEGDNSIPDMVIPEQQYVNAEAEYALQTQLGANWHFNVKNPRISPYVGAVGGFNWARINTVRPYTGNDDDIVTPSCQAGQAWAVQGGVTAGIDFQMLPGLFLGVEVHPAMYQFTVLELHPSLTEPYLVGNHSIKFMSAPRVKLGFRF